MEASQRQHAFLIYFMRFHWVLLLYVIMYISLHSKDKIAAEKWIQE